MSIVPQESTTPFAVSKDLYLKAYYFMLKARMADDKMASLYRAGKIHGGVFLGKGQEALSVSVGIQLQKGDIFGPLIRDGAGRLAFGEDVVDAFRTYMGSTQGPMRGRDGNVHRGRPREGLLPMISHLGSLIPVVNGMLLARRMQGKRGSVGATCLGDGGTSTGAFHEAINQAAVEKLPLIMVVANNRFAYSTPTSRQFVCEDLVDKAIGYGVQGHSVDGTSLEDCLLKMAKAIDLARKGGGPQLVVASLLRLCGHGEHDDASYISSELKQSPCGQDCLKLAEDSIISRSWMNRDEMTQLRRQILEELDAAVAKVQHEPTPDPFQEKWQALATEDLLELRLDTP